MATFTAEQRRQYAKSGVAMKDGSFPIPNTSSLDDAISAVGRARPNTESHHASVRRHIIKRARALGATNRVPDNWNSDGTLKDEG